MSSEAARPGPLKRSQFTRAVHTATASILHHAWRDHIVIFDRAEVEDPEGLLLAIERGEALAAKEAAMRDALVEHGFFVDPGDDEGAAYVAWHHRAIRERVDVLQITVVVSLRCNLQCPYCYQEGVDPHGCIADDTTRLAVDFVTRQLASKPFEAVELTMLGGEALLHPARCVELVEALSARCRDHAVKFGAGLVSNGTLDSPEVFDAVRRMSGAGLRWMKVTIDGDEAGHDAHRALPNGRGTWERVFANVARLAEFVDLMIGGNFNDATAAGFASLIDRLAASSFRERIRLVRFKPILDVIPPAQLVRRGRLAGACASPAFTSAAVTTMLDLDARLVAHGLPIQDRADLGPCEIHQRHSVTIGPDGALYNCPAFVGHEAYAIGDVRGGVDAVRHDAQLEVVADFDETCLRCEHLPRCAGGCRYASYQRAGRLDPKTCDAEYLSRATDAWMRRMLARSVADEAPPV